MNQMVARFRKNQRVINKRRKMQPTKPRKTKIKAALREQVWLRYTGPKYESKCATYWCENKINVFNFQCGHLEAEAKGGPTTVENLIPLCSRCNQSMGTMHMNDWNQLGKEKPNSKFMDRFFCKLRKLFTRQVSPNDH